MVRKNAMAGHDRGFLSYEYMTRSHVSRSIRYASKFQSIVFRSIVLAEYCVSAGAKGFAAV